MATNNEPVLEKITPTPTLTPTEAETEPLKSISVKAENIGEASTDSPHIINLDPVPISTTSTTTTTTLTNTQEGVATNQNQVVKENIETYIETEDLKQPSPPNENETHAAPLEQEKPVIVEKNDETTPKIEVKEDSPKTDAVEPVKQPDVEPVKQPDVELVKQPDVEPVKQPEMTIEVKIDQEKAVVTEAAVTSEYVQQEAVIHTETPSPDLGRAKNYLKCEFNALH